MSDWSGNKKSGSSSPRRASSRGSTGGKKATAGKGKELKHKDPARQY